MRANKPELYIAKRSHDTFVKYQKMLKAELFS